MSGGVEAGRCGRVELCKEWSDKPNRYEEPSGWRVIGLVAGAAQLLTRLKHWFILQRDRLKFFLSDSGVFSGLGLVSITVRSEIRGPP
jgi:hypothetical protein